MFIKNLSFFAFLFYINLFSENPDNRIVLSEDLEIIFLKPNSLIHVSYTNSEKFGRFGSNGLIYINNNEAVMFDTPSNDSLTIQLLDWFEMEYPNIKITAAVINHFHDDCLGGLNEIHKRKIKSYSFNLTPALAGKIQMPIPQIIFSDSLIIKIGDEEIFCKYFGEAHTKDNIAAYIPAEYILFGGCMVKSLNSGKGNLEDANVNEWSNTVMKVKDEFENAEYVIPGHGNYGGTELLDYTITLFKKNQ
jgi:metallo-beta-lactamase class B